MNEAHLLPAATPVSAPFWQAARRHRLEIQHCGACDRYVFYPRAACPDCGADALEWRRLCGRGRVYSYTIARVPTHPAFAGRLPLVIAIVALDEGPRITTNIIDCAPEAVHIDMAVEAVFCDLDEAISLVHFRPVP